MAQNPPSPVGFQDILSEDEFSILVLAVNNEKFVPSPQQAIPLLKSSLVWDIDSLQELSENVLFQANDPLLNMQILSLSIDAGIIFNKFESLATNIEKYVVLPSFSQLPLGIIYRILTWYYVQIPINPSIIHFILSLFYIHGQAATPIFALIDISAYSVNDLYDLLSHNLLDMNLIGFKVQERVLQLESEGQRNKKNPFISKSSFDRTNKQYEAATKHMKQAETRFNNSKAKYDQLNLDYSKNDIQI